MKVSDCLTAIYNILYKKGLGAPKRIYVSPALFNEFESEIVTITRESSNEGYKEPPENPPLCFKDLLLYKKEGLVDCNIQIEWE